MKDLIQVEGSKDLFRDKNSQAVINKNSKALHLAKLRKKTLEEDRQRLSKLEEQMDAFGHILAEILKEVKK